jgi:hypothetical protein
VHGLEVECDFVWRPFPPLRIWALEAGGLALMSKHRRRAQTLFAQLPAAN